MTTTTEAIPQSMVALARGNELRMASAEIRREISKLPRREALVRVAELFDDPPESIQRTRADLVLCAVPRLGQTSAWRILSAANAYGVRYVGPIVRGDRRPLTERQRRVIAAELRRMAGVGTESAGELREAA